MKREGLSLYQAKRAAQDMADKTEQKVLLYKQHSVTGAKHFGIVNARDAKDWQIGASTRCAYPRWA